MLGHHFECWILWALTKNLKVEAAWWAIKKKLPWLDKGILTNIKYFSSRFTQERLKIRFFHPQFISTAEVFRAS